MATQPIQTPLALRPREAARALAISPRLLWQLPHDGVIGQAAAFVIAMTAIGGAIGLSAFGKDTEGLAAILRPLVALTLAFRIGKISRRASPGMFCRPEWAARPSPGQTE